MKDTVSQLEITSQALCSASKPQACMLSAMFKKAALSNDTRKVLATGKNIEEMQSQ